MEKIVNAELEKFIDTVYHERYNLFTNNCIHKHRRIVRKARDLGHEANLIGCLSARKTVFAGIPVVGPHVYARIDGKVIDVSMDPASEAIVGRNEDVIYIASFNIDKVRPMSPSEGPPLPKDVFPKWPWAKEIGD